MELTDRKRTEMSPDEREFRWALPVEPSDSQRETNMLAFDKKYRQLLHAELDELLDVSETVRTRPNEFHDAKALAEHVARKWAVDSFLMATITVPYGRDRVVERLNREIELYRRTIETRRSVVAALETTEIDDIKLIENYERAIALIEKFIAKLDE